MKIKTPILDVKSRTGEKSSVVPPCFTEKFCALCRIPTYPSQLTYASRRRILGNCFPLTAPSAVHLTSCVVRGSQHPPLSATAHSPLSPPQWFVPIHFLYYMLGIRKMSSNFLPAIHHARICREKNAKQSGGSDRSQLPFDQKRFR